MPTTPPLAEPLTCVPFCFIDILPHSIKSGPTRRLKHLSTLGAIDRKLAWQVRVCCWQLWVLGQNYKSAAKSSFWQCLFHIHHCLLLLYQVLDELGIGYLQMHNFFNNAAHSMESAKVDTSFGNVDNWYPLAVPIWAIARAMTWLCWNQPKKQPSIPGLFVPPRLKCFYRW